MRKLLCTLAFLVVALPASAETLTLASKYDVVGTNPDGSKYKGTADVDVISNSTFKIKWSIGTSTIEGFGMRMNNSLAATYEINGEAGLVIYRLDGNGFDGLWAIRGHNGSGTEHLTPR